MRSHKIVARAALQTKQNNFPKLYLQCKTYFHEKNEDLNLQTSLALKIIGTLLSCLFGNQYCLLREFKGYISKWNFDLFGIVRLKSCNFWCQSL